MSNQEDQTITEIRDVQWYKDYSRISEETKMKLYRYVWNYVNSERNNEQIPVCIENPKTCITKLLRLLKKNRMFQARKIKQQITKLEGILLFCLMDNLLENKETNQDEIESKKRFLNGLQVNMEFSFHSRKLICFLLQNLFFLNY